MGMICQWQEDSNPGPLGGKCEHYLCALQSLDCSMFIKWTPALPEEPVVLPFVCSHVQGDAGAEVGS